MGDKAQRKIRIKWVRSGIGFSYRAKDMVRSLGLRRLRQVVERPDTPQVRGLVAKIPHLVEIVKEVPISIWGTTPEYTISPSEAKFRPERAEAKVAGAERVSAAEPVVRPARKSKQDKREKERAAASKAAASKQVKLAAKEKAKATRAAESKKKERPAREKRAKPSGKGKK